MGPVSRRHRSRAAGCATATLLVLVALPMVASAQDCDPYADPSCNPGDPSGTWYDPSTPTSFPEASASPYDGTVFDPTPSEPTPTIGPSTPATPNVSASPTTTVAAGANPSTAAGADPTPSSGVRTPPANLLDRSQPAAVPNAAQPTPEFRGLLAGRLVLALDAMAELGAFTRDEDPVVNSLINEVAGLVPSGGLDAAGYRAELVAFDADLPAMIEAVRATGVEPGPNLRSIDMALDPALLGALESGATSLTDPLPWFEAIGDVLRRGGAAPIGDTVDDDDAAIFAFVQQFALPTPSASPATTVTSVTAAAPEPVVDPAADAGSEATPEPGSNGLIAVVGAVLVGVIAAAAAVVMSRRRRRNRAPLPSTAESAAMTFAGSAGPAAATNMSDLPGGASLTSTGGTTRVVESSTPGSLMELLDASRRMIAALDPTAVAAIACGESIRMVGAEGAMLVRREDAVLRSAHHEPAHLFDVDGLDRSLLRRVIETGRSNASVATEEASLVDVPVALAAVAIVADGTVVGALMVVRRPNRPFGSAEVEALETLAPLVGSALVAARAHGSATELADRDALTGLSNRRRLDRDLAALDPDTVAAYVMVDVDHFKRFNDSNGHAAGDVALQAVSRALTENVRPGDRVYRYGGEEFCVLLPTTTEAEAQSVAERMRQAVESTAIPGGEHQPDGRVTISVGVADTHAGVFGLVERADAALYRAKTEGRNRVCVSAN